MDDGPDPSGPVERMSPSTLAGVASIAAGGTGAFAAGSVGDHRQAVLLLVMLAATQLSWGLWAVLRTSRTGALLGVALHLGVVALWLGAATSGLSFVQGMEERWSVDALFVVMVIASAAAGFGALARLIDARAESEQPASPQRVVWTTAAVAAVAFAVAASVSTSAASTAPADDQPAAPAVTTTVASGPIGLPTGGGDIDQELGKLIEASESGSSTTDPATTSPG